MRILGAIAVLFVGSGLFALACGGDDDAGGGSAIGPDGSNGSSSGGSSGASSSGSSGDVDAKGPAPRWGIALDGELLFASTITVTSDAIYVSGMSTSTSPYEWIVQKRSPADGALVPTFGTGGTLKFALPDQIADPPRVVAEGPDIYVGYGYETTLIGKPGSRLEKRSASTGAVAWTQTIACFEGMIVDDLGLLLGCHGYVERRSKSDGNRVSGFGDGGVVYEPTAIGGSRWEGFLVEGDSFVMHGQLGLPNLSTRRLVERRNRNTGVRLWATGTNNDTGLGCIYGGASDGTSLYLSGADPMKPWLLEKRALSDGALVPSFADDGGIHGDVLQGSTIHLARSGDTVYIANFQQADATDAAPATSSWWVEAIDATSGAPRTGFGTNGTLLANPSGVANDNRVLDIDADDGSIYLLGSVDQVGRLERRDRATGSL